MERENRQESLSVKGLLFVMMTVSLCGCSSHCYRARPLTLNSTNLTESVSEAFSTQSVCEGVFYNEKWWTFFKDPQLNQFIEISLSSHPNIKAAEASIRLAYEQAKEAKSVLLPHFSLIGNPVVSHLGDASPGGVSDINVFAFGLGSSLYELDIWNKNRSLYYSALDEVQAQIADFKETQLLLSSAVAQAYFNLQLSLSRLKINQERLKARKGLLSILDQQYRFGIISEYRLYEVSTEVQILQDLVYQIEGDIEISYNALSALVGNVSCCPELKKCMREPSARFDKSFPLPKALPIDLLVRRPDITAQRWRIEGSCYEIKASQARFYPSIDLFGLVGGILECFKNPSPVALGTAIGALPLFTAGKLQAQLGVAQETLEIAIENYNQLVLNAVQQVSDALTRLTTSDERAISLQRSIKDAEGLLTLTSQKFENGIANKIPVLNAIENLLIQKDLENEVQLLRFLSAVELMRAIGGGYYDCL
ncbi:MAG: efflux transporter outer membrane subunit [Chlamydiales bacterium]